MNTKIRHIIDQSPVDSLSSLLKIVNRLDADKSLDLGDPLKVTFLRNLTIEGIEPYLKYHFYRSGLATEVSFGAYDNIQQEVMSADYGQTLYDIVILSLWLSQFEPDHEITNWSAETLSGRLMELFSLVRSHNDAIVVANTFIPPLHSEVGIGGETSGLSLYSKINQLNQKIKAYADNYSSQFFVIDWERLVMRLGESASIDTRLDYLVKAPFKPAFLNLYAEEIAKIGRALRGKSKKCLVLDCDNTLWGGIIGEDGRHGIKLDRNEYPGKAFYDFHKSVLQLYDRGVLIALCSKNNETDVWDVIEDHPHSLIKREHLSAYRINWSDKPSNIVQLAEELNLGLDSFVFVDDSDFECEFVSQSLPEVTVLQVPSKLYEYSSLLFRDGLFDTLAISQEDKGRTEMYQAEAKRQEFAKEFNNIDDYLASLELKVLIHPVKEHEIPRVAQLTQKTNQFNLTTRRYSEAQIMQFANSSRSKVFSLTMQDKFGDSGLTGVFIARRENDQAYIDTLLLSCRVLGRKLELEFINHCIQKLNRDWKPQQWLAEYIPTKKNHQVSELWDKFFFSVEQLPDGTKKYRADANKIIFERAPFITTVTD